MGETRVDLTHLLEGLRASFPGALEETIITGIVAAALDAGASAIRVQPDPHSATLTVVDDGRGMQRAQLRRHHNVTASGKPRAGGIGTTRVGVTLALLVAEQVMTETRRGATHLATAWHLATRYRAPLTWITPPGLVGPRGTAVRITLTNPLSPLLDAGYLEEAIRAHFTPLLDPAFDALLQRHYGRPILFEVDGRPLGHRPAAVRERVTVPIRLGRRRLPSAVAVLERHGVALPDDRHGIALSTRGQVIKRGWDWLGLAPAAPFRITGLVEAPELAACLVPGRPDVAKSGPRAGAYLAHRRAIRLIVTRQLSAWGDTGDAEAETRARTVRLEPDLKRVLELLTREFPRLRSLAAPAANGQERLPLPDRSEDEHAQRGSGVAAEDSGGYRLRVQLESRPDDGALGRLEHRTVWINEAHPAYVRATTSRASGYHAAVAVALTLAPLAGEATAGAFVTQFLAHWGGGDRPNPPF